MKTTITAISLLLASALSAQAHTITNDQGGYLPNYHKRYKAVAASGERVVIDGPCLSACTLVLHYVPAGRICATPRAVLGFHKVTHDYDGRYVDPKGTRLFVQSYPRSVQAWIARRGGQDAMPVQGFWSMQGPELARYVRPCQ